MPAYDATTEEFQAAPQAPDYDPIAAIVEASRQADQLQQQGVRLRPPGEPTDNRINLGALMRLPPNQRAQAILSLPPLAISEEQKKANEENYQRLQNAALAGVIEKSKHARALADYQNKLKQHQDQITGSVQEAGPVLADTFSQIKSQGQQVQNDAAQWNQTLQGLTEKVRQLSIPGLPTQKLSVDDKGKIAPVIVQPTDAIDVGGSPLRTYLIPGTGRSEINEADKKRIEDENFSRRQLAAAFNRSLETAKQKTIDAEIKKREWEKDAKAFQSLLGQRIGGTGFIYDAQHEALVHPGTKTSFALPKTPINTTAPQKFTWNPQNPGALTPVGP